MIRSAIPVLSLALIPAMSACERAVEGPEAPTASAGAAPGPGFHFVEVGSERGAVKGAVYVPRGMDGSAPAPAIVFLHGYGECGTDGSKHLGVGLPNAIVWDADRWPFVVIAPQKPEFDVEWEDYEDGVFAMLDLAVERHGVDPGRVAITGLSQGGHGTIAIASRNPDRFVAAAPVCGYVERWNTDGEKERIPTTAESPALAAAAEGLAQLPVWIFHGELDDVVLPSESRLLHAAIEQRGGEAQLTIFPDANHNAWDPTYRGSGVWAWFAEQLGSD